MFIEIEGKPEVGAQESKKPGNENTSTPAHFQSDQALAALMSIKNRYHFRPLSALKSELTARMTRELLS